MVSSPATSRRFRFGLRSLFALVTVACMWVAYSANWIRQRHAMLVELGSSKPYWQLLQEMHSERHAPAGLRLLGEQGVNWLSVEEKNLERARRLFPEAEVEKRLPLCAVGELTIEPE